MCIRDSLFAHPAGVFEGGQVAGGRVEGVAELADHPVFLKFPCLLYTSLRIEVDQAELVGYFVVFAHAAVKIRIIYDKQRTAPTGVYLVVNVHFTI